MSKTPKRLREVHEIRHLLREGRVIIGRFRSSAGLLYTGAWYMVDKDTIKSVDDDYTRKFDIHGLKWFEPLTISALINLNGMDALG